MSSSVIVPERATAASRNWEARSQERKGVSEDAKGSGVFFCLGEMWLLWRD
jgi:hypothetical protein